jgi:hypothetical protein
MHHTEDNLGISYGEKIVTISVAAAAALHDLMYG